MSHSVKTVGQEAAMKFTAVSPIDIRITRPDNGVDWEKVKRLQDEMYGPLEHLNVCICTQGPCGVIIDHDCGRVLAKRRHG